MLRVKIDWMTDYIIYINILANECYLMRKNIWITSMVPKTLCQDPCLRTYIFNWLIWKQHERDTKQPTLWGRRKLCASAEWSLSQTQGLMEGGVASSMRDFGWRKVNCNEFQSFWALRLIGGVSSADLPWPLLWPRHLLSRSWQTHSPWWTGVHLCDTMPRCPISWHYYVLY